MVFDMRGKESLIAILIISLFCTAMLSCGGKKDEPIYKPEGDENRYSGEAGGLYNIEGNAPAPDTTTEETYQSPFGPKPLKQIQWAPSLRDAINRVKPGSGLKVLMWCVNDACEECDKVEKDVFSSEAVLKHAGKYIWFKFNTDTDPEMKEYYVQEHEPPDLVRLDGDGNGYRWLYGGFDDPDMVAARLRDWH